MKARTVCCSKVMDMSKAKRAKTKMGMWLTCSKGCKNYLEKKASTKELRSLMKRGKH